MNREQYMPGPAQGAEVRRNEGESWTLVLVRSLAHPPAKVWEAITEPKHLREWAPFDSDTSLAIQGTSAKLTTVGAPAQHVTETKVSRAEPPRILEYTWGGGDMRWELEEQGKGTRLTLWTNINRQYIAMGAAGWHIALDILGHLLNGDHIGRITGPEAMQFEGWQRLHAEYSQQFGVKPPSWS